MNSPGTQEIEDYLSQLRSKGNIDSEGHFTVAGLRAVGKLATFLLEDESDWILKIIQAACAAEARELHIKQTHRSTQVQFKLPFPLDLQDFEKNLVSLAAQATQPGVDDLINGLRAVGMGQLRTWVASLSVNGEKALISCNSGELAAERRREERPAENITELALGIAYPENQSGKLGGILRFGEAVQNEHMTLLSKARTCSIPLFLDGRRIDDLFEPTLATALQSRVFLGVDTASDSAFPSLRIPAALRSSLGEKLQAKLNAHTPLHLAPLPPERRASSIHRWYFNYSCQEKLGKGDNFQRAVPSPSRVFLVRKGVVVGRKNLGFSHAISVDVFMSADGLRTDLTGLKVEPDDEQVSLAKQAIRDSSPFLQEILAQLTDYSARPLSRDLLMYGGIGVLSLLSPWFAVKAVTGAVSGLMLARSAQNQRELVQDCKDRLLDFCELLKRSPS